MQRLQLEFAMSGVVVVPISDGKGAVTGGGDGVMPSLVHQAPRKWCTENQCWCPGGMTKHSASKSSSGEQASPASSHTNKCGAESCGLMPAILNAPPGVEKHTSIP